MRNKHIVVGRGETILRLRQHMSRTSLNVGKILNGTAGFDPSEKSYESFGSRCFGSTTELKYTAVEVAVLGQLHTYMIDTLTFDDQL